MYSIIYDDRAVEEIYDAVTYYRDREQGLAFDLNRIIESSVDAIIMSPYFRKINYRLRSYKIRKFPYSIIYGIDEGKQIITIYSFFHSKRDPKDRPS